MDLLKVRASDPPCRHGHGGLPAGCLGKGLPGMSITDAPCGACCLSLEGMLLLGASPVRLLCPDIAASPHLEHQPGTRASPDLEWRLRPHSQPSALVALAPARALGLGWPAHPGHEGACASWPGQQSHQQSPAWLSQAESVCCHGRCSAQKSVYHPSGRPGRVGPRW